MTTPISASVPAIFLERRDCGWHSLAHRTQFEGIRILKGHRAVRIDVAARSVEVKPATTSMTTLYYDKLLIGTGATPSLPEMKGVGSAGVFLLHSMGDSFAVKQYLDATNPRRAIIIGAGYIGLDMADALTRRGMEVIIASRTPSVLPTVDAEFGRMVEDELTRNGVKIFTNVNADEIRPNLHRLRVSGSNGFQQDGELVLLAVGVKPNTRLGVEAGLKVGAHGAFLTNRRMQSGAPDVYVAGDCAETWHRLLQRYTYLPLGTTSHKQGRIAGENAIGGSAEFAGSLGTQVVKVFDLVIGRTGLKHDEAAREGFQPLTVQSVMDDHKAYYPGATPLHARVTGDRDTGELLGSQLLGTWSAEVSKRLDVFAIALFHKMTVAEITDLDLSYTPPLSSPWDPVQMAAQIWNTNFEKVRRGALP
jgi:NADPH-dependent 2,4-dienoyl-CoA reductase/sulfur reductase-like enzyme